MSNKVTYAEIIEALSREADFSKQKSEAFAKALIGRVKKELEESGKASITNFGSFKVKEVAERQGQNPRTGEPIIIPAHNRVSFTPYKALKEKVNAKYAHLKSELIGEKAGDSESEETSPLQTEQKPEEKSFFEKEKESTETKEPASDTIFQFDDEAIEEEEKTKASGFIEPEVDETEEDNKNPFAFDEPDEEQSEPDEVQLDLEEELEPSDEDEGGSNMILIMSIAAIFAVALVSVWWFFLRTEPDIYNEQQAVVQQANPTQQPSTSTESDNSEIEAVTTQEQSGNPETMATEASEFEQPVTASSSDSEASVYQVNENEWFWVIAEKVYGMSRFWPLIYQENFTLETHPDSLANSTRLQIPELEGTAESPSKDDYLRLAEASLMVSEAYQNFGRTDKAEEYAKFAKKWERLGSE